MRRLKTVIILGLFPITTGSSQQVVYTDSAQKQEYQMVRSELDSILLQKKVSLDLLEYKIQKDSLPK